MHITTPALLAAALLAALPMAHADTLSEVRALLSRQVSSPLKALIEVRSLSRNGEGKELEEQVGEASVQVEDGPQGLRVAFARDLLQKAEAEERAKAGDPKSKTPALTGLGKLEPGSLRELLNPAASLGRLLDRAKLKSERQEAWQGRPATLLSFDLEKEKLTGRAAEFVKHYSGTLELWVGPQGLPLAAKTKESISGRAFLVFSFEQQEEDEHQFGLLSDRLVLLKSETRNHGSGTIGKNEQRSTRVLKPLS